MHELVYFVFIYVLLVGTQVDGYPMISYSDARNLLTPISSVAAAETVVM